VDVFDLDRTLVADYASFARSFTQIRAQDIRDQVDAIYASRRFWPEPLITVNPHFERGASVEALVSDGSLHPDVARVFRVDGQSITLYRHQMQAVAKATARQSFAVTTGTGSGKSLCFFIPIIDAAIRARATGEERRTRAIVIYPMNALANSQREELTKFLDQSGLPENLRPTFARYTGQESQEERERIREAKPDIMLTNFMMLELLMTRQNKLDQTVIENAQGLENALALDFVARQKVGGTHIRKCVIEQFPVIPLDRLGVNGLSFIIPRVLELTYTGHSMAPFARDLGYDGAPFAWDEDRRAQLRAELDAWYARAYGLTRDELRYILDPADVKGPDYPSETFPCAEEERNRALWRIPHRPPRARRLGCAGGAAGRRPMTAHRDIRIAGGPAWRKLR
jgi:hypothetical protein